jgi:hypothetical protein
MRRLIAWVFMYSLDGLLADEGTEYWQFCFGLPNDPRTWEQKIDVYQSAYAHIMGRATYEAMAGALPTAEPIVIRTSVTIAATPGAEPIATGEVLEGSTLGGSPFCVGGTILDFHGSPDPAEEPYGLIRTRAVRQPRLGESNGGHSLPSFLRVARSSSPPAANPQVERMIRVSDPYR